MDEVAEGAHQGMTVQMEHATIGIQWRMMQQTKHTVFSAASQK